MVSAAAKPDRLICTAGCYQYLSAWLWHSVRQLPLTMHMVRSLRLCLDLQVEHFFCSLANTAGMTLHIRKLDGKNSHHIVEATFKVCWRPDRLPASLCNCVS